jgi:hypothetical protein
MRSLKHSQFRISSVLVLLWVVVLPLAAANLNGSITYKPSGTAKDVPLGQAMVSVYNTSTRAKSVTLSSSQGVYQIRELAAGSYVIIVEKSGRRIYQGRTEVREPATQFNVRL